jgi:hypothetical protein
MLFLSKKKFNKNGLHPKIKAKESILPNFFLRITKIFSIFSIKFGHFKVQTIFSYALNTQA